MENETKENVNKTDELGTPVTDIDEEADIYTAEDEATSVQLESTNTATGWTVIEIKCSTQN